MTKPIVVLHHDLPPGVHAFLTACPDIETRCPRDDAGVAAALAGGAEVLVTHTWRAPFLTPSLRWIAGTGAGFEQYPLDEFEAQGIVLTTAAGVHTDSVAEHAFALLLSLTRRIGEAARNMEQARWQPLIGDEIVGRRMLVVGLGRIGDAIARRAQSWGMEVAGIKRNPATYDGPVADVRGTDALVSLCAWADIVVLAQPARADGRPVIGAAELAALADGWIVNIGRGSLIDEPALITALKSGALRGAGLDVTATEPLPADSPLWRDPKVVVTAHNAGASPAFGRRWGVLFERNLAAYIAGGNNWVNRLGRDIPRGQK
ncbi:D-2-hydroxyacid dehydrogenase [Tropicimonas sp. IMCC6043]|uniref:D-2-hydroxyacid dehydrogenase n=1 Tax=Tropicimonas sp. IMCC6043 TaxID=2510645 RepID=UPI00101DD6CA|nr:D-2-hydroxyacid dehydrogenase [Tropicimonas sp. IMCC6043]RYH07531.1 D-2-hydroxyacid dehydrogenase [Tropicimonas sp. IMCC6043]